MTREQFRALTPTQKEAMHELWKNSGSAPTFEKFVRSALAPTPINNYVAIPNFHGMFVAIEDDGYTHS